MIEVTRTITKIIFDWFHGPEGEVYSFEQVGENGVTKIEEHMTAGEGTYYDIYYDDNTIKRIFNINKVYYYQEEKEVGIPF